MYTKEEKFAEAALHKALQNLWAIVSRRDLATLGQESN